MSEVLAAGFGKTTMQEWIGHRLPGHSERTEPATESIDRQDVRVAVIRGEAVSVALVLAEVIAFDETLAESVAAGVGQVVGIPADQVLVLASHTHTGPPVFTLGEAVAHEPAQEDLLTASIRAAADAAGKLAPVTEVRFREGTNPYAVNRRRQTPEGVLMQPNRDGYVDHGVPILSFVGTEGVLGYIAVLPMHPTVLSTAVTALSGDLAGGVARKVESETKGAVCLMLQGVSGDVRPDLTDESGEFRGGNVEEMLTMAEQIGKSCLDAGRPYRVPPGSLAFAAEQLRLELSPGQGGLTGDQYSGDAPGQGEELPNRVCVLRLGADIGMVFLPGEPFGEIGEEIRRRSSAGKTVVAAHAGPTVGYVPTPDAFDAGGYEIDEAFAFYGFPAPLGRDSGERLVDAAIRGVLSLFG